MAKTDYKTVDEFIAVHPEDVQDVLRRIRQAILEAVPAADEVISISCRHTNTTGS